MEKFWSSWKENPLDPKYHIWLIKIYAVLSFQTKFD